MLINKKRIRTIGNNVRGVRRGDNVVVSLRDPKRLLDRLTQVGFSSDLAVGQTILPTAIGPVSKFNAEGKYHIHKDKPMETAYRQAEWTWQEFRGRHDTVERSKIVDIPYERFPRTFIEPPSIELSVQEQATGEWLLISPRIQFLEANDEKLVHTINLFLELFGECELLRSDLTTITPAKLIRLNWQVLPKGKMPWTKLEKQLRPIINKQPEGNRVVIEKRHETINIYEPDFVAVGQGGFDGYVIFGFPLKSLYILESTQTNNATYVLDRDWEELSGMTKAELLNNNLHKDRLIHRESWFSEIRCVLGG